MGRQEEGYTEIKRAAHLDPHSMVSQILGFTLLLARRFDEAIVQFEEALDLDSGFASAQLWGLSNAFSSKSLSDRDLAAGRRAVELSRCGTLFVAVLGEAYAAAGCSDEARNILQQLQQSSNERYVSPYAVGRIYATMGQKDEALHWLEVAYAERSGHMVMLKMNPRFDHAAQQVLEARGRAEV
jgi:serine/threonine-protein kinase